MPLSRVIFSSILIAQCHNGVVRDLYLSKGSVYERSRNHSSQTHCIVITYRALHKRERSQTFQKPLDFLRRHRTAETAGLGLRHLLVTTGLDRIAIVDDGHVMEFMEPRYLACKVTFVREPISGL